MVATGHASTCVAKTAAAQTASTIKAKVKAMLFYLDQILLPLLAAAKIVDTTTAVAILILIFLFMIRIYNDFKQYL
jgi:hypothetical protein